MIPDWGNQEMLHVDRKTERCCFIPYESLESAKLGEKGVSRRYKPLNGNWSFKYYDRHFDVQETDLSKDVPLSGWEVMPVPSNWQMFGYGLQQHANADYHFTADRLFTPDDNPCGIYAIDTIIPETFCGLDVNLVFEGVSACFYLYINGKSAGYSRGGCMQSEFGITELLEAKTNRITVLVLNRHDKDYPENQDFCRLSGIFRDVYMTARPKSRVIDFFVKTDLSEKYEHGELTVEVEKSWGERVTLHLFDNKGNKIAEREKDNSESFNVSIARVQKWTAETPYLYFGVLECNGEFLPFHVGFRKLETTTDATLLINGNSVKLKGVNSHDNNPVFGRYTTVDDMITDLVLMKRHNINTVKYSHNSSTPEFLNLCDKYGFYVIVEADWETAGKGGYEYAPYSGDCDNNEWADEMLDRAKHMVERDKNHPCVIMWSMGNESGSGKNFELINRWIRERDESRLINNWEIMPGGTPDPVVSEARWVYQYIDCELLDSEELILKITNNYDFLDLSGYEMAWNVSLDGEVIDEGVCTELSALPKESELYVLPVCNITNKCHFGLYLNVSFLLKKSCLWAEKGFMAASSQLEIPHIKTEKLSLPCLGRLTLQEAGKEYFIISGNNFDYAFNRYYGSFEGLSVNGVEMLKGRSAFLVDRIKTKTCSVSLISHEDAAIITVKSALSPGSPAAHITVVYTVYVNGKIGVSVSADIMERFGFEFVMPSGNEIIEYYGMGPPENYNDGNHYTKIGHYSSVLPGQNSTNSKPRENGRHPGVKWAAVYDIMGRGMIFAAEEEFGFFASHHTWENPRHTDGLKSGNETIVRIDYGKKMQYGFCFMPMLVENIRPETLAKFL